METPNSPHRLPAIFRTTAEAGRLVAAADRERSPGFPPSRAEHLALKPAPGRTEDVRAPDCGVSWQCARAACRGKLDNALCIAPGLRRKIDSMDGPSPAEVLGLVGRRSHSPGPRALGVKRDMKAEEEGSVLSWTTSRRRSSGAAATATVRPGPPAVARLGQCQVRSPRVTYGAPPCRCRRSPFCRATDARSRRSHHDDALGVERPKLVYLVAEPVRYAES